MVNIYCNARNCKYLNGGECMAWCVEIDDEGSCLTFEDYTQDKAYQEEYYIAVATSDEKHARAKKLGKKIKINGEDFFTNSPPYADDEHTYITHARTGVHCDSVKILKERWIDFCKKQAEKPDVSTLPLAEFDETSLKYVCVTDEKKGRT